MSLLDELTVQGWAELENAVCAAAISGGERAREFYGRATQLSAGHAAGTRADVEATAAIVRSLEPFLSARLPGRYSYFGEEFEKLEHSLLDPRERRAIESMRQELGQARKAISRDYAEFRDGFSDDRISVLFDPLDGTLPFRAEMPFFSSAVAFLIGARPAVGAIYSPMECRVYCASLRGSSSSAHAATVREGCLASPLDLTEERARIFQERGDIRQIACQVTRSSEDRRDAALAVLPKLIRDFGNPYMLNAGGVALVHVAKGSVDAYLNNFTYVWDVAAGEVLVRAVGGKVTDEDGRDIDYRTSGPRIGIVAATSEETHAAIMNLIQR